MAEQVLVIACGALAQEITELKRTHGWDHLHLTCIDAKLHHRPGLIPERLREKIRRNKARYDRIYVAYADCGTRGEIDRVIEEEGGGIERLPGVHCYQFFAGSERFASLADAEPGTFYLTDFLAQHFDRFVIEPLKIDTHPQLRDEYFGNYRRVVFLSQTQDPALLQAAQKAAERLQLDFEHVHCGYGELESSLRDMVKRQAVG
ncbi:DUF1638 domain-containing protein [Gammaproteobacteria bacterium]|jgi:hypothetical protein|nr:DUF1638 domain-containing protein [Gammaproteobacteria bacterium]